MQLTASIKNLLTTKSEFLIKSIILILFVVATLFIGAYHEPWSDEAQAWLIARDTNWINIVTDYISCEGAPPLWHYILKICMKLGLSYDYLYLVSVGFTIIGVWILLFKSKFPLYISALLPFTYFIAFQYSIVARNYSMILPTLGLLACIYNYRLKHPIKYCSILAILAMISAHSLIFASGLILMWIYDIFKNKLFSKGYLIPTILLILLNIFICLLLTPPSDLSFDASSSYKNVSLAYKIFRPFGFYAQAFWAVELNKIIITFGTLFYITMAIFHSKLKRENIEFILTTLPLLIFWIFIFCTPHHTGLPFLFVLFNFWIHYPNLNKKFALLLAIIIIPIQLYWTTQTYLYDYTSNYSASKQVAKFLDYYYPNYKIYGNDSYSITAILPYFKENIFDNSKKAESFFIWRHNKNYKHLKTLNDSDFDILVLPTFEMYSWKKDKTTIYKITQRPYFFKGAVFAKTKIVNKEGFIVIFTKNN